MAANALRKVSEVRAMIKLKNVSKRYHMGEQYVNALDHVDLHIERGEFVSIVGPSGSGKSTMMNIIGCLDTADEGEYLIENQPVKDLSEKDLAMLRSRKIGFVFQNFNLLNKMTAEENVELPLIYQRIPANERKAMVEEALEKVQLIDRKHHKPTELSGGQQQRVAIARALVTRPSVFLADEPTGALDSRTGQEIMELFHQLHHAGNTIVVITHDEGIADEAERKIRMKDGKIKEVGWSC